MSRDRINQIIEHVRQAMPEATVWDTPLKAGGVSINIRTDKTCPRCRLTKPLTTDHYYRQSRQSDGWMERMVHRLPQRLWKSAIYPQEEEEKECP